MDPRESTPAHADERRFLHDLSSPLMIASGLVEVLVNKSQNEPELANASEKLQKVDKALKRIKTLVQERRAEIKSKMSATSESSSS